MYSACTNGWRSTPNTSSSGAIQQIGINNVVSCQQGCINLATCVAIDYDTANNQCWFHTNSANLASTTTSNGVTQYVRCSDSGELQ